MGAACAPLSAAVHRSTGPSYAQTRETTYTAYRRRLGPDADHLPADFTTVMTDIVAFADPLLSTPAETARRWNTSTRTWR